jgi:hypothetical protein
MEWVSMFLPGVVLGLSIGYGIGNIVGTISAYARCTASLDKINRHPKNHEPARGLG